MGNALDIHAASPAELEAAHRNVFDIWSKGLSLEDHLRYRLDSPSHQRASWFVGCLNGRVVVSLGCYPIEFRRLGETLPGMAIGSVYTVKEFRGRGFAPQLLAWVEDHERGRNIALGALYSDIKPEYYARLGYTLCPSPCGWRELANDETTPSSEFILVSVSPTEHLPAIMKLYADYHGATPLSVARGQEYWRAMLKKFPDDEFFALTRRGGAWAGYVRVWNKGHAWRITDFALADQSQDMAEQLYASLIALAKAGGAQRVGGWLPESGAARKFFALTPREKEITMIKPLAWRGTLSQDMIAAASRFCEIDHV